MADSVDVSEGDERATGVGLYALGDISFGRAAERVGMTRWEFEAMLDDAGFTALYGPRTWADLADEVDTTLDRE